MHASPVEFSRDGSTTLDRVWAELNLHLTRSKGLCLVFLYAADARALMALRTRLDDEWAWRTAPLRLLLPSVPERATAEVIHALEDEVQTRPVVRAPVWLQLMEQDIGAGDEGWELSRHQVLYRLNEWRTWLQKTFCRPLIVALPMNWSGKVAQVAPDLWHVRTQSARLATIEQAFEIGAENVALTLEPSSGVEQGERAISSALVDDKLIESARATVEHARNELEGGGEAVQLDLARHLIALAGLLFVSKDYLGASHASQEAVRLLEELCTATPDSAFFRSELMHALAISGDARAALGDKVSATATLQRVAALMDEREERLGQGYRLSSDRLRLASKLGFVLREQGRYDEALAVYQQQLDKVKDTDTFRPPFAGVADLAVRLILNTADLQKWMGRRLESVSLFRRAIEGLERYVQAGDDSVEVIRLLGVALRGLGGALLQIGKIEPACAAIERCVELLRRWLSRHEGEAEMEYDLCLALLSWINARTGRLGEAHPKAVVEASAEAVAFARRYGVQTRMSSRAKLLLINALSLAGQVADGDDGLSAALESLKLADGIMDGPSASVDLRAFRAALVGRVGDAYMRRGDSGRAVSFFRQSLQAFQGELMPADVDSPFIENLALAQRRLGIALHAEGNLNEAVQVLTESLHTSNALRLRESDHPIALDGLASSLEALGVAGLELSKKGVAEASAFEKYLEEALAIRRRLAEAFTDDRRAEALGRTEAILHILRTKPRSSP